MVDVWAPEPAAGRDEPDGRAGAARASGRPTRSARAGRRWPRRPRWSRTLPSTGDGADVAGPADAPVAPGVEPARRGGADAGRSRTPRRCALAARGATCCSPSGPRPAPTARPGRGGAARRTCRCPSWWRCAGTRRRWPARCAGRAGPPDPYARRGTAFHAWLEQRFGADRLLDLDELPGAADEDAAPDEELAALQERVPGRRVGRPDAGRGGGAVRDGGRRRGGPGPDGRGLRATRAAGSTSSTGRPGGSRRRGGRRGGGAAGGVPAGLGGAGRACRWSGCGRRSTTSGTG